ncbi:MAG: hypothetical protein AAGG48_18065 [Planctomycetota bacterium]
MKRQIKNLVLTAASIAVAVGSTIPAQACDRRGARSRVSISRAHYPVVRQPVYLPPSKPVCTEPRYVQTPPSFPPVAPQVQPVGGINIQQAAATRPAPVNQANPSAAAAPTVNPQRSSSVGQRQPASPAANASNGNTQTSEASALQMLASISSRQTTSGQTPTPETNASQTTTQIPQFSAAVQQPAASHIGKWRANLSGNQAVELTLNADGGFVWTATRNGKSSTFQGQFRIVSGKLTLVRSSDLQQMAGTWSGTENQFTFKLEGSTTGGLNFQRT